MPLEDQRHMTLQANSQPNHRYTASYGIDQHDDIPKVMEKKKSVRQNTLSIPKKKLRYALKEHKSKEEEQSGVTIIAD